MDVIYSADTATEDVDLSAYPATEVEDSDDLFTCRPGIMKEHTEEDVDFSAYPATGIEVSDDMFARRRGIIKALTEEKDAFLLKVRSYLDEPVSADKCCCLVVLPTGQWLIKKWDYINHPDMPICFPHPPPIYDYLDPKDLLLQAAFGSENWLSRLIVYYSTEVELSQDIVSNIGESIKKISVAVGEYLDPEQRGRDRGVGDNKRDRGVGDNKRDRGVGDNKRDRSVGDSNEAMLKKIKLLFTKESDPSVGDSKEALIKNIRRLVTQVGSDRNEAAVLGTQDRRNEAVLNIIEMLVTKGTGDSSGGDNQQGGR